MVENKLVIPDEMMQYLNQVRLDSLIMTLWNFGYSLIFREDTLTLVINDFVCQQVQAGGSHQVAYRGSPLPICQSPICTNPLHYQRPQPPQCNYNSQQQSNPSTCYPQGGQQQQQQHHQLNQQNTSSNCPNYQSPSPAYSQCPSSRMSQASGYCPPQNYSQSPNCVTQAQSSPMGHVMSPGSHYAPSHASDQPMTSPAAGALPPHHGSPQNIQQSTAQMSRNCVPANHHQNVPYYPVYGCQAQVNSNCGQMHGNSSNCGPASHSSTLPCAQIRNCQQMGSHCGQPIGNHSPNRLPGQHSISQCGQGNPCSQNVIRNPGANESNPQDMEVIGRVTIGTCQAMGSHCPQTAIGKLPIASNQVNQQVSLQSPVGLCSQNPTNCVHPGITSPRHPHGSPNTTVTKAATNLCNVQNNCRIQSCGHTGCQISATHVNQYGCSCQWNYNNEQCYNGHSTGEIQCRDISQSQQGSPVKPPQGMRQDSYRRTLEYVQQCRNWSGNNASTHETNVSSSTHPLSLPQPLPASTNMVVNDMTSSLSSLLEENRYLQMIQ